MEKDEAGVELKQSGSVGVEEWVQCRRVRWILGATGNGYE